MTAELWTRLSLGDGVELQFDSVRHSPTVEQLLELRDAARRIFGRPGAEADDES
jgi:hypothetical protein